MRLFFVIIRRSSTSSAFPFNIFKVSQSVGSLQRPAASSRFIRRLSCWMEEEIGLSGLKV